MKFKKVFRGYDPKEVKDYVSTQEKKYDEVCSAQKQRIEELADENAMLRDAVTKYKADEHAISVALVESNKLALELKGNAEKFSEITLSRAKIFYATWHAYSQTLISALSGEEVQQFNALKEKVERIINAFDGGNVTEFAGEVAKKLSEDVAVTQSSQPTLVNPLKKVSAAAHVIELEELLTPKESLAELCHDLGLRTKE